MQLTEVTTSQLEKAFLQVNVEINQDDPDYIRPLDKDIKEVFDPEKNKAFRFGEATRWILRDGDGKLIGRVAAFVNKKYRTKGDEFPVGGMGFFDCINNQEAADMLFDVAKHWLLQRGMEAMDGPINFGERDRWWGLMVDGFQPPPYCMNYNKPYYKELFENYGFRCFFNQYCYGLDPKKELSRKILDRHATIAKDPAFKALHIRKNKLPQFAADFAYVYNKAWAGHGGMKELKTEQVLVLFKKMKPVMDEKIVWFVYHNNNPIALFVNLPDLNQWFKYLNGRFDFWHKLKFLWIKLTKKNKRFTGIAFGVIPEFQGAGVDSYLINEAKLVVQRFTSYTEYELQWIGDWNPKMLNVAEHFGDSYRSRQLITYRYIFDRTREFKRHPVLN